jgi:hypothetical protein
MIPRNTPQTIADCPILQWASGHTQARLAAHSRFQAHVGFHIERERDSALDALLEAAGTAKIDIRHPRPGAFEIKPHWSFGESIRFYPVTAGPPATTISACLRSAATGEAGIGLAWPTGEKSRMAVRGLVLVGTVPILVQLSARSTMTGYLLAALLDHVRVCQAADDMIDRAKHPELVALHELALPLVAGAEVAAGRGETSQITPLASDHPEEITRPYVLSCWRAKAIHEAACVAWPGIVAWAAGYASGETNGDSHVETEEAPPTPRTQGMPIADLPL